MPNEDERKMIEINPNLLAHTMKNAAKKRTKKNKDEDEDDLGDLGSVQERKVERKTKIRMNEQLKMGLNKRRTQRYERKSLLREYRKKQEELMNETGGENQLIFSNKDGENKLILREGGSSLKIDTDKGGAVDDFSESVQFVKHLEDEIMEKTNKENDMDGGGGNSLSQRHHHHTMRKNMSLQPPPNYGCLKGGKTPTYREWIQQKGMGSDGSQHRVTQRLLHPARNVHYESSPLFPTIPPSPVMTPPVFTAPPPVVPIMPPQVAPLISNSFMVGGSGGSGYIQEDGMRRESTIVPPLLTPSEKEAQQRAKEINEQLKLQHVMREREEQWKKEVGSEKRGKRRKTIRRKLHTGKINDRVSILIPNKTIRNRHHQLSQKMHQTSIQDIKKYLLKRGFIKVGTSAPHDILRKMYADLHMLGGEVQNLNGENIVYNFKVGGGEGGSGDN